MERSIKVTITRVCRWRIEVPRAQERCAICRQQVEVIPAVLAIEMLKARGLNLDELLQAGVVHPIQTPAGDLWVCKESLVLRLEER